MSTTTTGLRRAADVSKGDQLPPLTLKVTRRDLIRYSGISSDCNFIHYSDKRAKEAGLPGVIAHGLLTMGMVAKIVTDWVGDPAAVIDYQARFGRPVVVPDDEAGTTIEVTAKVGLVNEDNTARVDIYAKCEGQLIFGRCYAVVRLA
ncbi:MaoC/PaaZ C-terminal domain-containing protein [Allokutzneria albata]|uniref:MaoC like domain-containing protein n=1 Tax=Allokutzneria albata TaxID=211114 RepID=A0A1G9Z2H6_ALLAB|nr:MaoC/PaaZ C-terminal domain-containing protein [Allokutzneria albata]SDN14846.1 MaoC like domain-containing protein [Allokutzneria albata]